MKRWKCDFCNKYILFKFEDANIGDSVDFLICKEGPFLRCMAGCVLFLEFDYVYVVSCLGFYRVDKCKVYPSNAPVAFIYNMFGVCSCEI